MDRFATFLRGRLIEKWYEGLPRIVGGRLLAVAGVEGADSTCPFCPGPLADIIGVGSSKSTSTNMLTLPSYQYFLVVGVCCEDEALVIFSEYRYFTLIFRVCYRRVHISLVTN